MQPITDRKSLVELQCTIKNSICEWFYDRDKVADKIGNSSIKSEYNNHTKEILIKIIDHLKELGISVK